MTAGGEPAAAFGRSPAASLFLVCRCLAGADGGIFAFGDAPYSGSLPASGVRVNDVAAIVSS